MKLVFVISSFILISSCTNKPTKTDLSIPTIDNKVELVLVPASSDDVFDEDLTIEIENRITNEFELNKVSSLTRKNEIIFDLESTLGNEIDTIQLKKLIKTNYPKINLKINQP